MGTVQNIQALRESAREYPAGAPQKKDHLPSLDGLRAVSIFLVLVAHSSVCVGCPKIVSAFFPELAMGALGVRTFFVISGFLITSLLIKEEHKEGFISLSAFYRRRVLRIFPAYYFYLLFVLIVGCFVPAFRAPWSTYVSAATFTTRIWGYWGNVWQFHQSWFLIHTWTLSVEEQFYLLWPACLVFLKPDSAGAAWRAYRSFSWPWSPGFSSP